MRESNTKRQTNNGLCPGENILTLHTPHNTEAHRETRLNYSFYSTYR